MPIQHPSRTQMEAISLLSTSHTPPYRYRVALRSHRVQLHELRGGVGPGLGERLEPDLARRQGVVGERAPDGVQVVGADRYQTALPGAAGRGRQQRPDTCA